MHSETTQRVTANLGEADSTESGRNQQRPLEEAKPMLIQSQEGGGSRYMWAQEESHTVRGGRPGGQAPQIGTTSQASTRVFKTHWAVEAGLRGLVLVTHSPVQQRPKTISAGGSTSGRR